MFFYNIFGRHDVNPKEYVDSVKTRLFVQKIGKDQSKVWIPQPTLRELLESIGISCPETAKEVNNVLQDARQDKYFNKERWEMEEIKGEVETFMKAFTDLGFLQDPGIPAQNCKHCIVLGARVPTMQERSRWADENVQAESYSIVAGLRELVEFEKKGFINGCKTEYDAAELIVKDYGDNWIAIRTRDHRVQDKNKKWHWRRADTAATVEAWAREIKPEEGDGIAIVSHAPFALRQILSSIRPLLTLGFKNLEIVPCGYVTDNVEQKLNICFLEVIATVYELTSMGELD